MPAVTGGVIGSFIERLIDRWIDGLMDCLKGTPKASTKTPHWQVEPSWGPNGRQIGRPRGLHVGKNCEMKSSRPKKSNPPKMVTPFCDFQAPSWAAKIVHFEEIRRQKASGKRFAAIWKRNRQKHQYRSVLKTFLARFAVACRSWRCGPRSIIYSTSCLSVLRR